MFVNPLPDSAVVQTEKVKVTQNGKIVSYNMDTKIVDGDGKDNADANQLNIANERLTRPPLIDKQGDKVTPIAPTMSDPVVADSANPTNPANPANPASPANPINLANDPNPLNPASVHGLQSGSTGTFYVDGEGRLRVHPLLHSTDNVKALNANDIHHVVVENTGQTVLASSDGVGHVVSNGNVVDGDVLSDDVTVLSSNLASAAHRVVDKVRHPLLDDSVVNGNTHLVSKPGYHIAHDASNRINTINQGQ